MEGWERCGEMITTYKTYYSTGVNSDDPLWSDTHFDASLLVSGLLSSLSQSRNKVGVSFGRDGDRKKLIRLVIERMTTVKKVVFVGMTIRTYRKPKLWFRKTEISDCCKSRQVKGVVN